jgi:hypothetical protein
VWFRPEVDGKWPLPQDGSSAQKLKDFAENPAQPTA